MRFAVGGGGGRPVARCPEREAEDTFTNYMQGKGMTGLWSELTYIP